MPALLILGHARTGTTAVKNLLNFNQEKVFILNEFNIHYLSTLANMEKLVIQAKEWKRKKIREGFHQKNFINSIGTSIPFLKYERDDLNLFINTLVTGTLPPSLEIEWLGDKIATCYRTLGGKTDLELLQEFIPLFVANIENRILLTFRNPTLTLLSTFRMFPEFPKHEVIQFFAEFFDFQLQILMNTNAKAIIWESNSKSTEANLNLFLNLSGACAENHGYSLQSNLKIRERLKKEHQYLKLDKELRNKLIFLDEIYKRFTFAHSQSNSDLLSKIRMNP